ncbi:Os06g0583501, partial [Oryza sativa Japonica Group]
MVDIDIHIENTLVVFEELEDGEDDVVDVAESRGLALLGVVEAAGPVDGDVVAVVELDGAADGSPGVGLAEAVEAVEDGAVLADVEALERPDLVLLGLRRDGAEEGDVVVGVEAAEVAVARRVGLEHLHLVEEAVVGEQRVGHPDAVRLHRVPLPVVVVPHLRVVEVAHPPLGPVGPRRRQRVPPASGGGVHGGGGGG